MNSPCADLLNLGGDLAHAARLTFTEPAVIALFAGSLVAGILVGAIWFLVSMRVYRTKRHLALRMWEAWRGARGIFASTAIFAQVSGSQILDLHMDGTCDLQDDQRVMVVGALVTVQVVVVLLGLLFTQRVIRGLITRAIRRRVTIYLVSPRGTGVPGVVVGAPRTVSADEASTIGLALIAAAQESTAKGRPRTVDLR